MREGYAHNFTAEDEKRMRAPGCTCCLRQIDEIGCDCAASRPTSNAALKADYADLGVSCGYIGDIDARWGDSRSFRVFTKLSTRPSASGCDISVHIFDVPSGHKGVWGGEIVFDTPQVRAKLDAIRTKLQAGQLYRVGAFAREG